MKALSFSLTGKVTGVGFRWAAQEKARELAVGGWIRNVESALVEGYVQGEDAAVDQFVAWLKKGPKGAIVKKVRTDHADVAGYRVFTVKP